MKKKDCAFYVSSPERCKLSGSFECEKCRAYHIYEKVPREEEPVSESDIDDDDDY